MSAYGKGLHVGFEQFGRASTAKVSKLSVHKQQHKGQKYERNLFILEN